MSNPTAKSSSTVLLSTIVNVCLSNAYMKSIENDWNQQCILPLTVVGKSSLTSLSRNLSKWKFDHSIELHHTVLLCYSKGRLFLSSPWNDRYSLSGFLLFLTKKRRHHMMQLVSVPFFHSSWSCDPGFTQNGQGCAKQSWAILWGWVIFWATATTCQQNSY